MIKYSYYMYGGDINGTAQRFKQSKFIISKRLIFLRRDNTIFFPHNSSQEMQASCSVARSKHFTILWRKDNASKSCHPGIRRSSPAAMRFKDTKQVFPDTEDVPFCLCVLCKIYLLSF